MVVVDGQEYYSGAGQQQQQHPQGYAPHGAGQDRGLFSHGGPPQQQYGGGGYGPPPPQQGCESTSRRLRRLRRRADAGIVQITRLSSHRWRTAVSSRTTPSSRCRSRQAVPLLFSPSNMHGLTFLLCMGRNSGANRSTSSSRKSLPGPGRAPRRVAARVWSVSPLVCAPLFRALCADPSEHSGHQAGACLCCCAEEACCDLLCNM